MSTYTYAEATLGQSLPDWLGSQVRALEIFSAAAMVQTMEKHGDLIDEVTGFRDALEAGLRLLERNGRTLPASGA